VDGPKAAVTALQTTQVTEEDMTELLPAINGIICSPTSPGANFRMVEIGPTFPVS
jgi:hypothetical protein